ncbi:unnamed protein product, partial [Ectocarpus sp. 12 AP-2014]
MDVEFVRCMSSDSILRGCASGLGARDQVGRSKRFAFCCTSDRGVYFCDGTASAKTTEGLRQRPTRRTCATTATASRTRPCALP